MSLLTDVVLNNKSPYDFIVNPPPGKHVPSRAERNAIVALWPFVTTMVQVGRESTPILIVSAIFGVLPLCLPLAFGYSGLPEFCASMPWGWAYCGGSATIEVFSLLIAAGYYVLIYMPCLHVIKRTTRRYAQKNQSAVTPDEWFMLVIGFLGLCIIFFFFFLAHSIVSAFLSPALWVGLAFYVVTMVVFVRSIRHVRHPEKRQQAAAKRDAADDNDAASDSIIEICDIVQVDTTSVQP